MLTPADRKRLVEEHLGYVRALATKERARLGPSVDLDELVAYGSQGLVEAAERFEPARGMSFVTYAHYRIRGAIFDGLREMGWLGRSEYARLRAEERANAYLDNLAQREAGATGKPATTIEEDVAELRDAVAGLAAVFVTSLEGAPAAAQQVPDPAARPDEQLAAVQVRERVRAAVARLPAKERTLVEGYYYQDRKLEEAGAALGLSKSWASRLHARAVDLLKAELAREGL